MTEPVFKGLIWGSLTEQYRPARSNDMDDESVGSFLARRMMNEAPGNNIVSAVLHGIYAGDINQLSIKSLMPMLWHYEAWKGSIMKATYTRMAEKLDIVSKRDMDLKLEVLPKIKADLSDALKYASVYSFKEGIGALSGALEKALRENPNVDFKKETGVTAVEYDGESDSVKVMWLTDSGVFHTDLNERSRQQVTLQPNTPKLSPRSPAVSSRPSPQTPSQLLLKLTP
tara:strand:- start:256 stop:939 length:684 start_codon:yes stop_codon:yes gene_type:complete